ncbi:MAG: S41 family peptidase, partial [Acidobacteriota bacterium]
MRADSTHSWRQIARCGFHAAGWAGAALLLVRSASPLLAGEPSDIVPHLAFFAGVFATGAILRRWSFALRLLTACVLLGWVAWRPEDLSDGRLALALPPATDAALLALACDRLLVAATSFGPTRAGRALRAATALAAAAFVALAATGRLDGRKEAQHANAYQQRSRLTTTVLDHLRVRSAAVERYFGSFADLEERYADRLSALNSACDPDSACLDYYRALRDMLAELNDGHTAVTIPGETTAPPVWIEPIGGEPVIVGWDEDPPHGVTGLRRGLAVETVDGRPVREVLEDRPAWMLASASPHGRVVSAHYTLLAGMPGSEVRLGVRDPVGHRREVTLRRPERADTVGGGAPPEVANLAQNEDEEESALEVILPRKEGEPAVIRIEGFRGSELHPRFSRALHAHLGAPGLVLDVRGNPGGWKQNAVAIAGHFFRLAWKSGESLSFDRSRPAAEGVERRDVVVAPRLPIYDGPIAVLLDHDTASAADEFSYMLCRSGRARCFGRTSAGEVHSVRRDWVGGVTIGIAERAFRPSLPGRLHGFGVVPHE